MQVRSRGRSPTEKLSPEGTRPPIEKKSIKIDYLNKSQNHFVTTECGIFGIQANKVNITMKITILQFFNRGQVTCNYFVHLCTSDKSLVRRTLENYYFRYSFPRIMTSCQLGTSHKEQGGGGGYGK